MMRFSEKEYARVREANADREELQEAQEEIARLRTALAEAQQENAELRADVAWVAHVYKSGDMWLLYPPSHNGSVRAFDGTDADLCRAIREARRGE